jgi:hypothetical protein
VSSDFERRLTEARQSLPKPDAGATGRARARALAALGRRSRRLRSLLVLAGALVAAIGLGVGIGASVAPSGTAARGPVGLGFLPEPGWFVLQSGARASTSSPAVAIASNVPFAADDDVGGAAESSALPYSTLLRLPDHGVVIAATFTPRGVEPWLDARFVSRTLPLRLPASVPKAQFGAQLRPEEPLGVYGMDAAVNGHNVDLHVYFGSPQPSADVIERAQRQLSLLVVRAIREARPVHTPSASRRAALPRAVIDHTYVCATAPLGGIYEIEARARAGTRQAGAPSTWFQLPLASVTTGGVRSSAAALDNMLTWVSAGRPSDTTTVIPNPFADFSYPIRAWGTLAVNRRLCRPTSARVPFTRKGLTGGAASQLGEELDCVSPRRVLVRVRAIASSSTLKQYRQFVRTTEPVQEARLAVQVPSGKPVIYAELFQSGKARLFTARGCAPD